MTAMPQMVAIYNGMGGGAAGGIAAVELVDNRAQGSTQLVVTLLGALIGEVSMSGSAIAWAKLQGVLGAPLRFGGQRGLNALVFVAALVVGGWIVAVVAGGVDPAGSSFHEAAHLVGDGGQESAHGYEATGPTDARAPAEAGALSAGTARTVRWPTRRRR